MSEKVVRTKYVSSGAGTGGLWFLGFIGSLVYFLHFHSGTLVLVVIAVFKSLFWPAYIVYYLLHYMGV